MSDPAFLMYSKDWLSGTAEMSHTEKGVFIDLLCYQHQNNGLPPQIEKIARIAGMSVIDFEPIWDELKSKFSISENGRLINVKLEKEIERRSDFSRKKTIFGIFGAFVKSLTVDQEVILKLKREFDYKEFIKTPKAELQAELQAKLKLMLKQYATATGAATATATATVTLLGKRGMGKKPFLQTHEIQNPFGDGFQKKWDEWKEYRKQIKKPILPISEQKAIDDLHKLAGGSETEAAEIIDTSIANGWQGLFEKKSKIQTSRPQTENQRLNEIARNGGHLKFDDRKWAQIAGKISQGNFRLDSDGNMVMYSGSEVLKVYPQDGYRSNVLYILKPGITIQGIHQFLLEEAKQETLKLAM